MVTVEWKKGNGRPKTARTARNVSTVEKLASSQENQPNTHRSVREISRETGIRQSSVFRIVHNHFGLKCLKKRRARELTESTAMCKIAAENNPDDQVNFMWFTDEKIFSVVAPKNPQNDRCTFL